MIFDMFLPGLKDCQYDIQLKDGAKPVRPRQYRYYLEQLNQWEQAGIIKEGTPTWTHPLVLVKKRPINPTDPPKYRVCLGLRKLNEHVIIQAHPIPTFKRVYESFQGQSPAFMSLMDVQASFLQVPVTEKYSKLLGIETDYKTYEMTRLAFGLCQSNGLSAYNKQNHCRLLVPFLLLLYR